MRYWTYRMNLNQINFYIFLYLDSVKDIIGAMKK